MDPTFIYETISCNVRSGALTFFCFFDAVLSSESSGSLVSSSGLPVFSRFLFSFKSALAALAFKFCAITDGLLTVHLATGNQPEFSFYYSISMQILSPASTVSSILPPSSSLAADSTFSSSSELSNSITDMRTKSTKFGQTA
jgi:hypothetical protein